MIRVPAIKKLMFDAKNVLEQFYLYILKIINIYLLVKSFENYGNSLLNLRRLFALLFNIWLIYVFCFSYWLILSFTSSL